MKSGGIFAAADPQWAPHPSGKHIAVVTRSLKPQNKNTASSRASVLL